MRLINIYYRLPYFIRYPIFILTGYIQARRRYGNYFHEIYKKLQVNVVKSSNEIQKIQMDLLKEILVYAFEKVPYYHRLFNSIGFNPYLFKSQEELAAIPILTKELIIQNYNDLIATDISMKFVTRKASGGTTGLPMTYLTSKELQGPFDYASLYRFYDWAGVKFKDKRLTVAGRLITKKKPYAMINVAENQLYVCSQYINNENNKDIVDRIHIFHPVFVQGHPSALSLLSEYMCSNNRCVKVKAIFTTSENLYPDQRTLIQQAFGGPVFDTYGMGEMVALGSECVNHNGLHLAPEYGFTEVINTEQYNSGVGEIISTSLQNKVMPLIRYKTGDLGSLSNSKCSCGCNFPKIGNIIGRIDDVIELETGEKILPLVIRTRLKSIGVKDFQLVFTPPNEVKIGVFLNIEVNKQIKMSKEIGQELSEIFGSSIKLIVDYKMKKIVSRSGKIQMIITKKLTDIII